MQKTVIRPAGEGDIPTIIALYRELDAAWAIIATRWL